MVPETANKMPQIISQALQRAADQGNALCPSRAVALRGVALRGVAPLRHFWWRAGRGGFWFRKQTVKLIVEQTSQLHV